MKCTFFISDIHLSHEENEISQKFSDFIVHVAPEAEAIYILGDLFDFWIGEDCMSSHQKQSIQKLTQMAQSIPTYWIPGNRDFLCTSQWAKQHYLNYLTDPTIIHLYDKKILLLHGDSLCVEDKSYQYYRKLVQTKLIQKLFLTLPKNWRARIAKKIRDHSQGRHKTYVPTHDPIPPSAINALWRNFNVNTVIHGHIHYPIVQVCNFNKQFHARYVLSDWGKTGNFLKYDDQHQAKLIYF